MHVDFLFWEQVEVQGTHVGDVSVSVSVQQFTDILTKVGPSVVMQNQDTIFQQVWSVRVHLTPHFQQKLTVGGRSYSRTTRYPVCHDHTFTIVCENHLFHVRLGPLGNLCLSPHRTEI